MIDGPEGRDRFEPRNWLMRTIDRTAEIVGASTGAVIGLQAGADPVLTAAVGATIAQTLKTVGEEIQERLVAPRERHRLTQVASLVVKKIKEKYDSGATPRADTFFDATTQHRAPAEEIFDGTFLAVQRDHEEKKLELYANLLSNIAFDSTVSAQFGNHLLALTSRLTYRQLTMIALFGVDTSNHNLHGSYREYPGPASWEKWSVLQEMYDLARMRLINNRSGGAFIDLVDLDPRGTYIDGVANVLFRLTEMATLQDTLMRPDIQRLVAFLQ
jgi:hypothetical protein